MLNRRNICTSKETFARQKHLTRNICTSKINYFDIKWLRRAKRACSKTCPLLIIASAFSYKISAYDIFTSSQKLYFSIVIPAVKLGIPDNCLDCGYCRSIRLFVFCSSDYLCKAFKCVGLVCNNHAAPLDFEDFFKTRRIFKSINELVLFLCQVFFVYHTL